eukprot:gene10266-biopygen9322
MHRALGLAGAVRTQKDAISRLKNRYANGVTYGTLAAPPGCQQIQDFGGFWSLVDPPGPTLQSVTHGHSKRNRRTYGRGHTGKRQRTRTGRGPDAGRTMEFEETDADRTRAWSFIRRPEVTRPGATRPEVTRPEVTR